MINTPIYVRRRLWNPVTQTFYSGYDTTYGPYWVIAYQENIPGYPIDASPPPGENEFKVTEWNRSSRTGYCPGGSSTTMQYANPSAYYRYDIVGPIPGFNAGKPYYGKAYAFDQNLSGLALQKAYAKVGNSDLELLTELGEIRETIAMLRSPMKSLTDFFNKDSERMLKGFVQLVKAGRMTRSSRRSVRKAGYDACNALTGTWLELRYGLRPLIGSIATTIEWLDRKIPGKFDSAIIRRKSSTQTKNYSDKMNYDEVNSIPGVKYRISTMQSTTVKSRAVVFYKLSRQGAVLDQIGLTPRFLPETAWELTRLSFVWDWLFSIGPWLGTLRFKPDITILGNTVSTQVSVRGMRSVKFQPTGWDPRSYELSGNYAPMVYSAENYERKINQNIPSTPLFRYSMGLDWLKTIDAVALILQSLLSSLRR